MKLTTSIVIAALILTNAWTIRLLRQEEAWSHRLMTTPGVEELVCGDEHTVVLKTEVDFDSEEAQIQRYEQYDPWDEDESIHDQSAND